MLSKIQVLFNPPSPTQCARFFNLCINKRRNNKPHLGPKRILSGIKTIAKRQAFI